MLSILFIRRRANATRNVQNSISAEWVWEEKSVTDWDTDLKDFKTRADEESAARAELRSVASQWQGRVDKAQSLTRSIVRLGKIRSRADAEKLAAFEKLATDGTSRDSIRKQGVALRDAWQETDDKWIPLKDENKKDVTLAAFGKLLDDCHACEQQQSQKLTAWRASVAALNAKAKAIDADSVAWYGEATTRFRAGSEFGNLIRTSIPTTSNPADEVGRAVITHLIASGGAIHFDSAAEHATRFTYFHQVPGAADYQLLEADTETTSVNLQDQPPGKHRFKAIGGNAQGQGDESEVAEIEVVAVAGTSNFTVGETPRSVTPVSFAPGDAGKLKSA